MSRVKLDEVPTEGKFGQTINVGDTVAFLTFSRGLSSTGIGTYKGLINGGARIEEDYFKFTRHHPQTGTDLTDWQLFNNYAEAIIGKRPERAAWRSEDYQASCSRINEYDQKRNDLYRGLEVRKHPAKRNRSLQLNFMFRLEKQ